MSKPKHRRPAQASPAASDRPAGGEAPGIPAAIKWLAGVVALAAMGVAGFIVFRSAKPEPSPAAPVARQSAPSNAPAASGQEPATAASSAPAAAPAPALAPGTMEVATAVVVTVELDFGGTVPTIAQAIQEIERRSQPEDGRGRTFAILDAYGEPTPDGRKLHISMHVSAEKPGTGALVFKRTGETLWQSRIVPPQNAQGKNFSGKDLLIYVDDGTGKLLTVDGSNNPSSILQANVKEMGVPMELVWPEGAEREVTFMYSACGCPVKVLARRVGDRTMRTKELPVIFPDDPAVVAVISRVMRW